MRRLIVGERVYLLDGTIWRVVLSNECRARLVPEAKTHKVINTPQGIVEFDGPSRGIDVSPFSILERV